MERETMRSITDWLLLASCHQEPVPSQLTAAGSCAQVTRPGAIPRGTPKGESGRANRDECKVLVAATERANCRRVIFIFVDYLFDLMPRHRQSANYEKHGFLADRDWPRHQQATQTQGRRRRMQPLLESPTGKSGSLLPAPCLGIMIGPSKFRPASPFYYDHSMLSSKP